LSPFFFPKSQCPLCHSNRIVFPSFLISGLSTRLPPPFLVFPLAIFLFPSSHPIIWSPSPLSSPLQNSTVCFFLSFLRHQATSHSFGFPPIFQHVYSRQQVHNHSASLTSLAFPFPFWPFSAFLPEICYRSCVCFIPA